MSMEQAESRAFIDGWALAASQVMRVFDQPTIAYELMRAAGITTRADIRKLKLEKFDTGPLYKVLKSEGKS